MKKRIQQLWSNKYLYLLFRLYLGFIFLYASLGKISDLAGFAEIVRNYRILPFWAVNIFAIVLPWIELFCGVVLMLGIFVRGGSLTLLGLLSVFAIAILINMIRGIDINCGCATPWAEASKIGFKKLVEELIMMAMGLQIFRYSRPFASLESLFRKSPTFPKKG